MAAKELLSDVASILVIDWPSPDVPESLARAGFRVTVKSGPGPQDYTAYECQNGAITHRKAGREPEHVDLVYTYRPLSELPEIVATARRLNAATIWSQSGTSAAGVNDVKGCWLPDADLKAGREIVESAGLRYVTAPYIGDAARSQSR